MRISTTQFALIPLLRQLCDRLEERRTVLSGRLAEEGRFLVGSLELWPLTAPNKVERDRTFSEVRSWNERAHRYLSGSSER